MWNTFGDQVGSGKVSKRPKGIHYAVAIYCVLTDSKETSWMEHVTYKVLQCVLKVEALDERLNVASAFGTVILLAHLQTLFFEQLLRTPPLQYILLLRAWYPLGYLANIPQCNRKLLTVV